MSDGDGRRRPRPRPRSIAHRCSRESEPGLECVGLRQSLRSARQPRVARVSHVCCRVARQIRRSRNTGRRQQISLGPIRLAGNATWLCAGCSFLSVQRRAQDARRGIRLHRLPPVLHIQLKRFECEARQTNAALADRRRAQIRSVSRPDGQSQHAPRVSSRARSRSLHCARPAASVQWALHVGGGGGGGGGGSPSVACAAHRFARVAAMISSACWCTRAMSAAATTTPTFVRRSRRRIGFASTTTRFPK